MARFLLAISLALLLGSIVTPSTSSTLGEVCSAACPDDGPDGACAPTCVDCGCCSHAGRNLISQQVTSGPSDQTAETSAPSTEPRMPAARPQDVFHVPKCQPA